MNCSMSVSYCDKLHKVLHAFLEGRFPKDDTMVEKLITWLESWLQSPDAAKVFMDNIALNTLLEGVIGNKSVDAGTLSFYLRLTSCFPSHIPGIDDSIQHLYRLVVDHHLPDPVVSNAWLLGLRYMLKNRSSLKQWIIKEDLHVSIISCLRHRSLFVQKAATVLLAALVVGDFTAINDQMNDSNVKLRNSLSELWMSSEDDKDTRLSLLVILNKALDMCPQDRERLCTDYEMFDKVLSVLESCGDIDHAARKQAMYMLTQLKSSISQENVLKLEAVVLEHLQLSSAQTAMVLAYWLTVCCSDKIIDSELLIQTKFLAINLITDSAKNLYTAHGELKVKVNERILSQGTFPQLFTRQLELLESYKSVDPVHSGQLVSVFQQLQMSEASDNPLVLGLYKKRHKLNVSIIHTLTVLYNDLSDPGYGTQMCTFVLSCADHLSHTQSAVTVQKSLAAIRICLRYFYNDSTLDGSTSDTTDDVNGSTLHHVCDTVRTVLDQLLCHISWEIIDSAVEFITELILQLGAQCSELLHERTVSSMIQLASHAESYLRASTITCLVAMATVPSVWVMATHIQDQESILDQIISATSDEEAFPRRAAVKAIVSMYDLYVPRSQAIFKVISKATVDLDWEVKKHGLDFWSLHIEKIQKCNSELVDAEINELYSCGCLQSVLRAVHDCDKTVQAKACGILSSLKDRYTSEPSMKRSKLDCGIDSDSNTNASSVSLLQELRDLDIAGLIELCSLTTDQYDANPEMLLDDILISVHVTDNSQEQDLEDNAIDCY